MIYYVCKYAPVEILKGFGEEYSLCNPMPKDFSAADNLICRNMCSFSRAMIETIIGCSDSELLLTSCCDSIQRASEVLCTEGKKVFMLNLPHNCEHCGKNIYRSELLKFINDYAAYSGKKFDCTKFLKSFEYNLPDIEGPYVSLMGARVSGELLEFIKKESSLPVRNNTCTGLRKFGQPPVTADMEKLICWYADELLCQQPCMRMTNVSGRKELVIDPNLKGIIYNTVSFCDFYSFEYAHIKNILSVPILKIETDNTPEGFAQMKTRLEAYFENLNVPKEDKHTSEVHTGHFGKRYTVGIDSGSTSTNVVILDNEQNIVSFSVLPTGVRVMESAQKAFDEALSKAGLSRNQIDRTVTTGYGRTNIGFHEKDVTEISCHAAGAHYLNPAVRTVIDIGGQDSKVIRLDEKGAVIDFVMNDKCAAGTGRFLDMMAQSLGLTLEEISTYGLKWDEMITISSMCSVFAQSEVVSLIAEGKKLEDIVHGLNMSVASKVVALGGRSRMEREYMMTGGVAKNIGVVRAIEEKLGCQIILPEQPEICGALGAAIIAARY